MPNVPAFAVKGAFAAAPAARVAFAEEFAAQPVTRVPVARAAGAMAPAVPTHDRVIQRPVRVDDLFFDPRLSMPSMPMPNPLLQRSELTVPAAPTATPADTDVFESGDGSKHYVLPRYALAFDKIGPVEEPRIRIEDRNGTPTLVLILNETPSPAAGDGTSELLHFLAVTLRYLVPVLSDGASHGEVVVQDIPFPTVLLDATETVVTAELPLTTPGQRQQILAALSSLEAGATLVVGRGITVGVPTDKPTDDGAPGMHSHLRLAPGYYRERKLLLKWIVPPAPLILSEAQRNRLGGGSGGVQPLIRHRVAFRGTNYSYWQDPARPEHFYFLPDRFLLARAPEGNRRPLLHI